MSEVLIAEKKLKSGGGWKLSVDQDLKLVKNVITGRMEDDEMAENCQSITRELKKFNKGEPMYLVDTSNMDMRFFSPKQGEIVGEFSAFAAAYCKKIAQVTPSFMLQKATETIIADKEANDKYFATQHEAMKWLLE